MLLATLGAPEGLDALAADDSLIPTKEVERARALRAEAGEAEAALRRVSGVQEARVVRGASTVNVVLRHDPGPPPLSDGDVRAIVLAALSTPPPGAVDVLFSAGPPPDVPAGGPGPLVPILGLLCLGLGGWAARRSVLRR